MHRSLYNELGPDQRYQGLTFGSGVPVNQEDPDFQSRTPEGKALVAAWPDGCPIPNGLISRRGAEAAIARYTVLTGNFDKVANLLRLPDGVFAHFTLRAPKERRENELNGLNYEPENVPKSHLRKLSPMSRQSGWCLSRIVDASSDTIFNSGLLAQCIEPSQGDELQFLTRLAEASLEHGAAADKVLEILFSRQYLLEQRTYHNADLIRDMMPELAPTLDARLLSLSREQRKELGVVEFKRLPFAQEKHTPRLTCRPNNY